ncbi:MAG: diaminopimelate epimerase [Clostridia bacterium]|nr:diaminopimelate epimerase [Clostridia bacterium]
MRFTKMHGLGNDYVYVNAFEERVENPHELAREIAHRHTGVGGDGLVLIAPSRVADFQMLMYNADGSQGEMCGNASRCVAKYVYDRGMTEKTVVTLETLAGVKTLSMSVKDGKVSSVRVDMGLPKTDCEQVPCLLGSGIVTKAHIQALDRMFEITPVNTGNPHGVIFLDEPVEDFDIDRYGPVLEAHPAFPKKANIEFVNVLSRNRLRMRVWERGSGVTMACGTGSCAVLVAANLCGLADRSATIVLDGGELFDEWDEASGHLFMTGPATHVFDGEYAVQK